MYMTIVAAVFSSILITVKLYRCRFYDFHMIRTYDHFYNDFTVLVT